MRAVEFEEALFSDDVVDLRAFDLVGGVFHFDLVKIPPQPKDVREWIIRESKWRKNEHDGDYDDDD